MAVRPWLFREERKTMKKILASFAALAAAFVTASARADLNGTSMTLSVNHAGMFSGLSSITNQSYTYGSPSTYTVPSWGSMDVTSPSIAPGMDNSLKLDFTNFAYSAFQGAFTTTGTVTLTGIAESVNLSSVKLLAGGVDVTLSKSSVAGGFMATWNTATIFAMNPINPTVVVAWNSTVPAPGSFALLGLAGLCARRGRRRA